MVSVLMTAYNREEYVAEAIESVLSSTYENFELIIVDDSSVDNTVSIAKEFMMRDGRVRVYVNEKNLGDYSNRNKAASYAKGKYLKYLDSDDKIYSWGLGYCVQMMERFPEAGIGIIYHKGKIDQDYLLGDIAIKKHFFESSILNIGPSGTVLRKSVFNKIGGFDALYGPASDKYFNLKIAFHVPVVLLKKDFFFYRIHDGQEFNDKYKYLCFDYKYLCDAFRIPGFPLNENEKSYLLEKAETYYTKDVLYYLLTTKKFIKTIKALSVSGITLQKFSRGLFNLILLKAGSEKFKIKDN